MLHELAWVACFQEQPPSATESPKQQCTALPGLPSWSWASTTTAVCFRGCRYPFVNRENLASKVLLENQQIGCRSHIGRVKLQPLKEPYSLSSGSINHKLHHTFRPTRPDTSEGLYSRPDEFAVFDALSNTDRCEGTMLCVACVTYDGGIDNSRLTRALIVAAVDGASKTYRRIGWLESLDAVLFEDEYRDIILV